MAQGQSRELLIPGRGKADASTEAEDSGLERSDSDVCKTGLDTLLQVPGNVPEGVQRVKMATRPGAH